MSEFTDIKDPKRLRHHGVFVRGEFYHATDYDLLAAEVAALRAALSLARDYVDANGGGWCRDGVGDRLVLKHIDAALAAPTSAAGSTP